MIRAQECRENAVPDEAREILALHKGDALEALRTLIAERDAVEERLAFARLAGRMQMRGRRL